ncbi:peptidase S24/S26A/S26B/S26C [Xylariomycetidae sp. FL2044]|nr:peptidase S24/S26A/S26B/S26C [Xylariomycetidae sp. FL2044]
MSGRGASNAPTFNPDDSHSGIFYGLFYFPRSYSELQRGMFIIFLSPVDQETYLKRIIGLPGDIIAVRKDCGNGNRFIKVPPAHYWVEGDAGEGKSQDSNYFGPVSRDLVHLRLLYMLFPFKMAGTGWALWDVNTRLVRDEKHLVELGGDPRDLKFAYSPDLRQEFAEARKHWELEYPGLRRNTKPPTRQSQPPTAEKGKSLGSVRVNK